MSVRRGCEAVGLPRSTYRYARVLKPGEPVLEAQGRLDLFDALVAALRRPVFVVNRT